MYRLSDTICLVKVPKNGLQDTQNLQKDSVIMRGLILAYLFCPDPTSDGQDKSINDADILKRSRKSSTQVV